MSSRHEPFGQPPSGRDLDRMLAFIDGELPRAECEQLLGELSVAERAKLTAMRADAQGLRALRAPEAPEELHEAIMASLERSELLAGAGSPVGATAGRGGYDAASARGVQGARGALGASGTHEGQGVIARPWAVRWRAPLGIAAVLAAAVGVGWLVWPQPVTPVGPVAPSSGSFVPVAFAPVPAPFALVLEFDDFDDADAALRSAMQDSPEAHVMSECANHCTLRVEGPPHVVGSGQSAAKLVATANCPTHKVSIPASELPRVLGALVNSGNGTIQAQRMGSERWRAPCAGTSVEVPVFIVPSDR